MPKLDKQDQRIANIFGTPDVPEVDTETLEHYLDHLQQHLTLPYAERGDLGHGDPGRL
jgi:hypothetical protein